MLCPRCQLMMTDDEYEGQQVQFCGNCWGHWVQAETLNAILDSNKYEFSEAERAAMLDRWASRNQHGVVELIGETIQCPNCQSELKRQRFIEECPVIVDICDEHGIWLDTGEIKELQIFFEQE